jgi:hypothetical protein
MTQKLFFQIENFRRSLRPAKQGDQIGQYFAHWAILYFAGGFLMMLDVAITGYFSH